MHRDDQWHLQIPGKPLPGQERLRDAAGMNMYKVDVAGAVPHHVG